MGTKPVPDQEEQRENEKEKQQEKDRAFSHCLNPLRVRTSLLSQIGIKNQPKIRGKSVQREKSPLASCCTATQQAKNIEELACL